MYLFKLRSLNQIHFNKFQNLKKNIGIAMATTK
jgi:hypothetical protein